MNRLTVFAIATSAILFLYILEMVRRRRMREEYSILWLLGTLFTIVMSVKKDWLERVSNAVGVYYPPSFLFLVGFLLILLILVHFSMVISKLHQMNKRMAQEIALLKYAKDRDTAS